MKPSNLHTLNIKSVGDILTAVDQPDVPQVYALESLGFRPGKEAMIGGERDFGTKHRYANYPSSVKLISNFNLYDKNSNTSYELLATLDGTTALGLWVLDSTYGGDAWNSYASNNNWINLSYFNAISTTLSAVSGTTADLVSPTFSVDDQFKNWVIVNTDRSNSTAWITASTIANNRITTLSPLGTIGWAMNDHVTFYRQTGIYSNFNNSDGAAPHIRWGDFEAQTAAFLYYGSASAADNYPTQRRPLRIQRYTSSRKYFYTNSSTGLVTIDAGWYVDSGGGGLIPAFQTTGSMGSPKMGRRSTSDLTAVPGTVTTNGTTTLVGDGAGGQDFTTYKIGQYILVDESLGVETSRRITAISNGTTLTVDAAFSSSSSGLTAAVAPTNDATIDDVSGNNWLTIRSSTITEQAAAYNQTIPHKTAARLYATVMYDSSTKESDPVWQGFFNSASAVNEFTRVSLGVWVSFAKMNKRISGLRFYYNMVDVETLSFDSVPDSASDYKLVFEMPFNSYDANVTTWTNQATDSTVYIAGFDQRALVPDFKFSFINPLLQAGATDLKTNLGHAVDTSRSYMTPRFSVNTARGGGGVMIVDQDDSTLRISSYNGAGVLEEDNFPDVTVDNTLVARQKIFLQSRGELIGLGVASNNVLAFKRTELEVIDLVSNVQTIIPIDCIARKSIVTTPEGVFWCGKAGIFFFPSNGSGIRIINPKWKNLYDGSLRTDDNANPRVSDANRTAIIAGYNPVYRDVWFYLPTLDGDGTSRKTSFRYFLDKDEWRARELNAGTDNTIQFFTTRKDNSFTVGYGHSTSSNGMLVYPTDTSSLFWEDDVTAGDTTASKGVPCKLLINVSDLYSITPNAIPYSIFVDAKGSMKSSTTGRFNVKLYANRETSAFDSKTQPYDKVSIPRMIIPRGVIERLRIELSLPTTSLSNFKDWLVSALSINFLTRQRLGTR